MSAPDPSPPAGALPRPAVSLVIPLYECAPTLPRLVERLQRFCASLPEPYELVFVDDGSRDGSAMLLQVLAARYPDVSFHRLPENLGQSHAVFVGMQAARGDILVTLDADLETGLTVIPRVVERVRAGADMVCGRRLGRTLPLHRRLGSRLVNAALRWRCGVALHDFGCGTNAGTRALLDALCASRHAPRALKIALLRLATRVEELAIDLREIPTEQTLPYEGREGARGSTYNVMRLLRGVWSLVAPERAPRLALSPGHTRVRAELVHAPPHTT